MLFLAEKVHILLSPHEREIPRRLHVVTHPTTCDPIFLLEVVIFPVNGISVSHRRFGLVEAVETESVEILFGSLLCVGNDFKVILIAINAGAFGRLIAKFIEARQDVVHGIGLRYSL